MTDAAIFALALLQLDGVGRVTAGRLLRHFASLDALRACPREQVLLRIKGAPNGETLVRTLFSEDAMQAPLDAARATLDELSAKKVTALTAHHDHWPSGTDELDRSDRPPVLYAYGHTRALPMPRVAVLLRPPLDDGPFERAQRLVGRLAEAGLGLSTGTAGGADIVLLKRAAAHEVPAVMVAHAGMARVPRSVRPAISGAVRAGGVLLSPFGLTHGPFDHDDYLRALLQTATADAVVFVQPAPEAPEARALQWAADHDRPAFVLGAPGTAPLPGGARPLGSDDDLGAVLAAAAA